MPFRARNEWTTELTTAQFQISVSDGWEFALGRFCVVNDVAYVREAQAHWLDWTKLEQLPPPHFNWVAIFNFNHDANSLAFVIDNLGPQALMLVKAGHIVRCDQGHRRPLVYVSFLEAAPWNRPATGGKPRLRGVGTAMLRAASDLSLQRGYGGRVGLHSVPAAEQFYRRFGFEALDCRNEYNEMYFELNEKAADELLKG